MSATFFSRAANRGLPGPGYQLRSSDCCWEYWLSGSVELVSRQRWRLSAKVSVKLPEGKGANEPAVETGISNAAVSLPVDLTGRTGWLHSRARW